MIHEPPSRALAGERYKREARIARVRLMRDLSRIPFTDGAGDRVYIDTVHNNGDGRSTVYFADAVTRDQTGRYAGESEWPSIVETIAKTARSKNADGWHFVVSGRGELFVYDWPSIVLHSGHTFSEVQMRGVSWCLNHRKSGEEAWT